MSSAWSFPFSKSQNQQNTEALLSSRILVDYVVPFLLGLFLGGLLVFIFCWGNQWEESDRVEVFIQVAPAPPNGGKAGSKKATGSHKRISIVSGCPDRPLQLLVFVLSAPSANLRRMAIRGTWMHNFRSRHVLCTTKFLVGLFNLSEGTIASLQREQSLYQDLLLLEDLKDSYANLSAKVLLGFEWSQVNKVDFDYLVKTDDDSFMRIEALSEALRQMDCPRRLYWGYFMGHAFPEATGKWMERNWFKCPHYMPYAMGGGYVLSRTLIELLMKFTHRLTLYNNEDVTVGSWLAPYRLERKHDLRFNVESLSHGCNNGYLITHKERVRSFYDKHMSLMKNRTLCSVEKEVRPAYVYNWTASPLDCCVRTKGLAVA